MALWRLHNAREPAGDNRAAARRASCPRGVRSLGRLGVLAGRVRDVTGAHTYAISINAEDATLGKALAPELEWITGDFLSVIDALPAAIDVIASVLPFNARARGSRAFPGLTGTPVDVADDRASQILAAASLRLSSDGAALYVVAPNLLSRSDSILRKLGQLGLGLDAAFALPAGTFAPYTNLAAYLIVVRRAASDTMFVAQLSKDSHTNAQIVENFRQRCADGPLELGRYVSPSTFRGLEPPRLEEQLRGAGTRFGVRAISLGEIAVDIQLGRPQTDFDFPPVANALFVPLIGNSNVVDNSEALTLKKQNYALIVIDPARSDARFVARFLNSELGRSIREAHKSGSTIPKLNSTGLRRLQLFVPSHKVQREILATDQRVGGERNTLLGFQNDLASIERDLWSPSVDMADVERRLSVLSSRLTGVAPHVAAALDKWFETLPFPLASILRAWQATASDDYRTKYEHLLHFFEAAAEFISVIYLSAFGSQPPFFEPHREQLVDAWAKQRVSLERPTFATWRIANEYLSKQTRQLMADDVEGQPLCAELFANPSLTLPRMLAHKDIATVFAATNKMRNDWAGHGGVVRTYLKIV